MGASVFGIKLLLPITVLSLIVLVLIGVVVYFLILLLLGDKMVLEFMDSSANAIKSRLMLNKI